MAFISNFTAVPRIILSDPSCSNIDKLVLGEINSLSYGKDFCYASNGYFAKRFNVGTRRISKSISNLKKYKYIIVKKVNMQRQIYLNPYLVEKENAKLKEKNCNNNIEGNFQYKRKYNTRKINTNIGPNFYNDSDGVLVWNGERCESKPCAEEELKELENLLKEYKGN